MKMLTYKIDIHARIERVFDLMLGIASKDSYEAWTAVFNPTTSYIGSWSKGSKMHFVGVNDEGKRVGMNL